MKTLDPREPATKKAIKASITEAILREIVGSNRGEVARSVEREYERLLAGAAIFVHIPSLTAGVARREAMAGLAHRPT
ncbi:MAG: hypothetical protein P4M09_04650 [Devosia sp.]|nr:hypothetical protein [Devosia sp.]